MMTSTAAIKVKAGIITPRISCSCWQRGQLDGVVCPQSGLSESGEGEDTQVIHCWVCVEAFVSTKQIGQGYSTTAGHPMSVSVCTGVCVCLGKIFID